MLRAAHQSLQRFTRSCVVPFLVALLILPAVVSAQTVEPQVTIVTNAAGQVVTQSANRRQRAVDSAQGLAMPSSQLWIGSQLDPSTWTSMKTNGVTWSVQLDVKGWDQAPWEQTWWLERGGVKNNSVAVYLWRYRHGTICAPQTFYFSDLVPGLKTQRIAVAMEKWRAGDGVYLEAHPIADISVYVHKRLAPTEPILFMHSRIVDSFRFWPHPRNAPLPAWSRAAPYVISCADQDKYDDAGNVSQ